jgi:hypothetical protein
MHQSLVKQKLSRMILMAFSFLVIPVAHEAFAASRPNPKVGTCTSTVTAALKACEAEAEDNFWIARGNCLNLADAAARTECMAESAASEEDAEAECAANRQARLDICKALGEQPYAPKIDPRNFVDPSRIGNGVPPNAFWPLVRGTQWVYEGEGQRIEKIVTDETKDILGVTCAVVRDVVYLNGIVIEDTLDWYAQDLDGNVWYFGEISQSFEDGELVNIDGSWKAGVDSAKPGIIMLAVPKVGVVYRQEFALGNAEDMGKVVSTTGTATSKAGSCKQNCVITEDFFPFDPLHIEHKYFAPGIGMIQEVALDTGARKELVEFKQ